jgi:hypothetical protein
MGSNLERITKAAQCFSTLYTAFAEECLRLDQCRWHLLRKMHPFIHLFEDIAVDRLNPRHFSGWTDETFMHHVVSMAAGKDTRTAINNVLSGWWAMVRERWRDSTNTDPA